MIFLEELEEEKTLNVKNKNKRGKKRKRRSKREKECIEGYINESTVYIDDFGNMQVVSLRDAKNYLFLDMGFNFRRFVAA